MSNLHHRTEAFAELGNFLRNFSEDDNNSFDESKLFNGYSNELSAKIDLALASNGWFTKDNILFALKHWGELLRPDKLNKWLNTYSFTNNSAKKVAIIMAGNIPLVGFHDFLCVLLTGHNVIVKLSDSDRHLLPVLISFLKVKEPSFIDKIQVTNKELKDFDAVIATGSDNTARYFEYYFSKKPHIIRKNRNSIAILTGKETVEDLEQLGEDIFRYFGLGCRNVSKIMVPQNYNFESFFNAIFKHKQVIDHHKYANNYDYNKAVYLMSLFELKDNGFIILKEDKSLSSPIGTLFYEFYDSETQLKNILREQEQNIQCIVSSQNVQGHIPFGQSQKPSLDTYADGIDTVDFLLKI